MRKTYQEVVKQLTKTKNSKQKLNRRMKELRKDIRKVKNKEANLIIQYEKVIKDWQNRYKWLENHGWKLVVIKLNNWINKLYDNKKS